MTPQAAGLWVAQMGRENMGKGRGCAISDHTEWKHLLRYPEVHVHREMVTANHSEEIKCTC